MQGPRTGGQAVETGTRQAGAQEREIVGWERWVLSVCSILCVKKVDEGWGGSGLRIRCLPHKPEDQSFQMSGNKVKSRVSVIACPSSHGLGARNREFPKQESYPEYPTDEDAISTSGLHTRMHTHVCTHIHA